ncbi:MAG: PhoU domain-containing protein [Candidatus Krumholzibacteria bacterium]|nr:PhoU domain-containing protein [Candidatus Krumholzibacteria bacterium]
MWKEIWSLLSNQESLLSEAYEQAASMLELDRRMFSMVLDGLEKGDGEKVLDELREMDLVLNDKQQEIRKKVFEHLAVSRGQNLMSGLVLVSIVIDLERIGDYTKNIGELVTLFPGSVSEGELGDLLREQSARGREIFELARKALVDQDAAAAKQCMDLSYEVSLASDGALDAIVGGAKDDASVSKDDLAMVLLLRYLKRVSAHLKNIASSTVASFPRIGYALEES